MCRFSGYRLIHDRLTWAHTNLAHDWLIHNHIRCIDTYPSASPDLNAVESVLVWMNNSVQRRHLDSQQRLEMLVRQAWEAILNMLFKVISETYIIFAIKL